MAITSVITNDVTVYITAMKCFFPASTALMTYTIMEKGIILHSFLREFYVVLEQCMYVELDTL